MGSILQNARAEFDPQRHREPLLALVREVCAIVLAAEREGDTGPLGSAAAAGAAPPPQAGPRLLLAQRADGWLPRLCRRDRDPAPGSALRRAHAAAAGANAERRDAGDGADQTVSMPRHVHLLPERRAHAQELPLARARMPARRAERVRSLPADLQPTAGVLGHRPQPEQGGADRARRHLLVRIRSTISAGS